jgi:hypothetical protein
MPTDARSFQSHRYDRLFKGYWNRRARGFKKVLSKFVSKQYDRDPAKLPSVRALYACYAGSQLQQCCERALDAYTLEDAIFWHSEVINELSVEIYLISAKPWSAAEKDRTLADLTDLQDRHGAILQRLTGIVARHEQLIWSPASRGK